MNETQMETRFEPTMEDMEALPLGTEIVTLQVTQMGMSLDTLVWDEATRQVAREHNKVCGSLHILVLVYVLPKIDVPDEVPADFAKKGH